MPPPPPAAGSALAVAPAPASAAGSSPPPQPIRVPLVNSKNIARPWRAEVPGVPWHEENQRNGATLRFSETNFEACGEHDKPCKLR